MPQVEKKKESQSPVQQELCQTAEGKKAPPGLNQGETKAFDRWGAKINKGGVLKDAFEKKGQRRRPSTPYTGKSV